MILHSGLTGTLLLVDLLHVTMIMNRPFLHKQRQKQILQQLHQVKNSVMRSVTSAQVKNIVMRSIISASGKNI